MNNHFTIFLKFYLFFFSFETKFYRYKNHEFLNLTNEFFAVNIGYAYD